MQLLKVLSTGWTLAEIELQEKEDFAVIRPKTQNLRKRGSNYNYNIFA